MAAAEYVLLTTFRRSGAAVPTPVWAARDGDELLVWTVADSGKVKRVRRSGEVTLARCSVRGTPEGPEVRGTARVLDADGTERARRAIRAKYGLRGFLVMTASRLRRGSAGTVGLAISL
ncbi:PPOX class F420-dependent oxidoreductase [Rhodococcus aerolatus]